MSNNSNKVTFTKICSPSPLSKQYWSEYNADKQTDVICKKANVLTYGLAKTVTTSFNPGFYNSLVEADSCTAFCYGQSDHKKIKVTTKASGLADNITYITRSKNYLSYKEALGIMMMDYDPSIYCPYKLNLKKFLNIIIDIFPAFDECEMIVRHSVSAGVHFDGQKNKAKGFHVYVPVLDASDIPRFGKLLHQYLWAAGYGYIALAKDGKILNRSPIDVSVFSGERLDFVGTPVVYEPLRYDEPECVYWEGNVLNTSSLKLRHLDCNLVDENLAKALKRIKPEQKRVQEEYDHQQVLKLVADGYSAAEAQKIVARNRANDYQILDESHTLHFASRVCTIREAIELELYGESCADPIEGTEYGTTTAQFILYRGQPYIRSMAHGGRNYRVTKRREHNISVIDAHPGVGKTRAICINVRKINLVGQYTCIVLPTTDLMSQYKADLLGLGFAQTDLCLLSYEEGGISVGNQLGFALKENKRIIMITHAFLKLMTTNMYKRMAHYHVYIDEVFYALLNSEMYPLENSVASDGILNDLCVWEPIDGQNDIYNLRPKKAMIKALNNQAKKPDEKKSISNEKTNKVLKAVKDNSKLVVISKMERSEQGNYCIAEMYNCKNLQYFKSVTIASAFIKETELYHWLGLHFNMIDVTDTYRPSFQNLDHRMSKLSVLPFLTHYTKHVRNNILIRRINSSKTLSVQQFVNRIIKGCSYFDEDTIRILNNDDFITLGLYTEILKTGNPIQGNRISSQVHGQNGFKHINSAIIVAAFNLESYQTTFLSKLLPFYDPWLERNVFTTIQCFMRTSLRDKDSNEPVYVLVPDERSCEAIVRLYNGLPKTGSHCLAHDYEVI